MPKTPIAPTRQDTVAAAHRLDRELSAAGVGVRASYRPGGTIELGPPDAYSADALAQLVHSGLQRHYRVASQLRGALYALGIEVDPALRHGRIELGEITIPKVDALALALGAPPQPDLHECPDDPEAELAVQRLDEASAKTIGRRITGDLIGYCRRCDEDPTLDVHALPFDTARLLAKALQRAAKRIPAC